MPVLTFDFELVLALALALADLSARTTRPKDGMGVASDGGRTGLRALCASVACLDVNGTAGSGMSGGAGAGLRTGPRRPLE